MDGLTISLTSIPPRFEELDAVCASLVTQGTERVCLWIPDTYARFPDWDGTLPRVPDGVDVKRCEDFGPATKVIPAMHRTQSREHILICDDDCIYEPGWVEGIWAAANDNPGAAIAGSAFPVARLGLRPRPSSQHLIVQGFSGVFLTPQMIEDIPLTSAARYVDDIWLSAALAAKGTRVICPKGLRDLVTPMREPAAALQDQEFDGHTRAQLNRRAAEELRSDLGIWA